MAEPASPTPEDPFHDGMPVIEGQRIRLRPCRLEDAPEVYRLYADKEAVRFGYAPRMEDLDDARTVIQSTLDLAKAHTLYHFGVAEIEGDSIIGHATLFHWDRRHRRAEVGYSVRRDLWGRGLATEALSVLARFAFERLAMRRLEADVDPRNTGSLRVLEKLGFVREGYLRQRWEIGGEIQDGIFFGLLRPDWERCR